MNNLDRLIADLKSVPPSNRVLVWGGWDVAFPPSYTDFREYLFRSDELLAALTGQPVPPPTTIRVRIVNATPYLRVRDVAKTGAKIGELRTGDIVVVDDIQTVAGWYRIAEGVYAGGWISAEFTEKVI